MLTLVSFASPTAAPAPAGLAAGQPTLAESFCALIAQEATTEEPGGKATEAEQKAAPEVAAETTGDDDGADDDAETVDSGIGLGVVLPPATVPIFAPPADGSASTGDATDSTAVPAGSGNDHPGRVSHAQALSKPPIRPEAIPPSGKTSLETPPAPTAPEAEIQLTGARAADRLNPAGGSAEGATRFRLSEAAGPAAELSTATVPESVPAIDNPALGAPGVSRTVTDHQPREAASPQNQAASHLIKTLTAAEVQIASRPGHSELTLAPEELGRVRFEIRQHGDSLAVALSVDNPDTLELLKRHANELRSELASAGFGSATLDFGNAGGSRQNFTGNPAIDGLEEFAPAAPVTTAPLSPILPRQNVVGNGLDIRL